MLTVLVGCSVDERVLDAKGGDAANLSTCNSAAIGACGSSGAAAMSANQAPSPCNDLNDNQILDRFESILDNSALDSDSGSWDLEMGIGVGWNQLDACAASDSGSLNVTYQKSAVVKGNASAASVQCRTAQAEQTFSMSAMIYPRASGTEGQVGIAFFSSPDCAGTPLDIQTSAAATEIGAWARQTTAATAPTGSVTLQARLTVGRADWQVNAAQADALFDSVLLEITE